MVTRWFAPSRFVVPARPWLAALVLLLGAGTATVDARPPNIVLMVCDNLRYGDVEPFNRECLNRTLDFMPTFAKLAETHPPTDRILDGFDIRSLLLDEPGAKSPYVAFYYYEANQLHAVRSGPWKLYLPRRQWGGRLPNPAIVPGQPLLFDVTTDPGEITDLAAKHPQVVAQIEALAEVARKDIGDGDEPGRNQRPHGDVENPRPLLLRNRRR